MSRKKIAMLSTVLAGSAFLLSGCGTTSATSTAANGITAGTVSIALPAQTPPNWFFPIADPAGNSVVDAQMFDLMYKPLVFISSSDTIDYQRSLAKSITVSGNDTVYTIQLNPKWRWSNGTPVTSKDVVFTANLLLDAATSPNAPFPYANAGTGGTGTASTPGHPGVPSDWASVKADGPDTVVITTTKPVNPVWFEHNGLGQIVPVPESIWNKYPGHYNKDLSVVKQVASNPSAAEFSVVDGPFKFDAADSKTDNEYWTFVPNAAYDGHRASLKKVIFEYETSTSDEFAALKTGSVDVGYLPQSMYASRTQLTNDNIAATYALGFNFLVPNLSPNAQGGIGPVFDQTYVRQALQMGIDQKQIIDTFYHGYGVPTFGPIDSKPSNAFYDTALTDPDPYNIAAGKKLLESHGWTMKNGVMTSPSGEKLAFTLDYLSGSDTAMNIVQLLKSDWAKEGIDVTLESVPFDTLIGEANQGDPTKWQMAWWGGGWSYEPDYYPTGGELFLPTGGANASGFSSNTMNSLIDATYAPGTGTQETQRMDAYQAYASKALPDLWMPWGPSWDSGVGDLAAISKSLNGVTASFDSTQNIMYPNYWTVAK
ncbi:MAG: peptide ABC transporter substrate-binding protein [Firmicutes bacterium]|nr:peptide ABC transporter substrate-binding protein [Bacillota bacterium]